MPTLLRFGHKDCPNVVRRETLKTIFQGTNEILSRILLICTVNAFVVY